MHIAVDIGGTKTEIGFFHTRESDSQFHSRVLPTPQNFDEAVNVITAEIKDGLKKSSVIEGIGVSFPGIVDTEGNLIQGSNIRDYEQKPLKKRLQTLSKDVRIVQDSTCSAIAELIFGQIDQYSRVVHLILGTGLGGTFLEINSQITIVSPIEPCGIIMDVAHGRDHTTCTTQGLLESYVGGGTLEQHYSVDLATVTDDHPLWDDTVRYLAAGINNLNCILKPEAVIIGGGIGAKRNKALANLKKEVKRYTEFVSPPKVEFTKVRGNSSLLGALALFSAKNLQMNT